jgi:hypothetical protein
VIVLLVAFLILSWAAGLGLTFLSRMPWDLEGRLAAGFALGVATAALVTWVIAIPIGMSGIAVLVGALMLVLVTGACWRWTSWRQILPTEAAQAVLRWRTLKMLPLAILLGLSLLFFVPFYSHAFEWLPDGLYAGHINIWGDWAAHLGLAGYLSTSSHLLPPASPWFSGTHLSYSFLPDFFSSILTHLGLDIPAALALPSAILSLALVVIFFSVALRLTGSRWAALAGALIFFLGGGLGFLLAGDDIIPTEDSPFGWIAGLANFLVSPPRDYTWQSDLGYWWRNPIIAYLVPQRTALFGWMLALVVLALLWHWWKSESRRELLLAGILVGVMPIFHANTYVDLMIISGGLLLLSWRRWKQWVHFFIPATVIGAPLLLMLLPPPGLRHGWQIVQLGWMASTQGHSDNVVWFWLANTALLIPLALVGFLPGRFGIPELRRFLLPTWLLFILPNIFVFQPWDFDNTKWFMWWAIPASIVAGLVLVRAAGKTKILAALAVVAFLVQITSGALDLSRAWKEPLNTIRLLDNDELALAYWTRANTDPEAVFLTAFQTNPPIRTMAERQQVMGGLVTLWTTDIDYRPRQQDVESMFRGDAQTPALLQRYGVRYVVIGPQELHEENANLDYYKGHYPLAYQTPAGEYYVFAIG